MRYGPRKRVVCRYQDGSEEEIPFEQYQAKAALSEAAAIDSRSEELALSKIEEIIFEHPELDLCRSGVEIVDSPGLNEHPNRTAITHELLKETDAAIFLTNASRTLTQGERDLIQDLRTQLNGGNPSEPAHNLFVVVNFMDLLRREKDRQDVQQRTERLLQGQNPLIAGENRIHFISAQAALDAISEGIDNEHLQQLQNFTHSIEKFLTTERGLLEVRHSAGKLKEHIYNGLEGLLQAEKVFDGKIQLSEEETRKVFEQIGEASGRDERIRLFAAELIDQTLNEAIKSWTEWCEGLRDRLYNRINKWSSPHSPFFSQKELIKDYENMFLGSLSAEIDAWASQELRDVILKQNLGLLGEVIQKELNAIQAEFCSLEVPDRNYFIHNLKIDGIDDDFMGFGGVGGGIGIGAALAVGLFAFTGVGLVALVVSSIGAALAGGFGLGIIDVDGQRYKIRDKVFEVGFQKFNEWRDNKFYENLRETINSAFQRRVESTSRLITQTISLYENLLEQQETFHAKTLGEINLEKAWIAHKRQELEQIQSSVEAILQQCTLSK